MWDGIREWNGKGYLSEIITYKSMELKAEWDMKTESLCENETDQTE